MAKNKSKKNSKGKGRPAYCVVLLNLDKGTERGDKVRSICKELDIPVRTPAPERLGDQVGAVAGLTGFRPAFQPYEGPIPQAEFMLMANLPNSLCDKLLLAMRDADVSVDFKAMVTKFNKTWRFIDMVTEVSQEHETLQEYLASQE